jgi:hypothetical protein
VSESIDDYKPDGQALLTLMKGDPGTAKSPAAASYPEPYILDLDGRIASVASYWSGKKKVQYDTLINDYPKLCDKMESLIRYNPYGTVILDSITTLARSLHTLIFQARGAGAQAREDRDERGKARIYLNAAKIPNKFEGIPVLEIDDYKTESTGIIQILDACRVLWNGGKGCNVVVIAHVIEVEQKDLKNRVTRTRAIMTGGRKIAAEIPVYFNEAYHFYNTPSGGYEIITKADGEDWAKTSLQLPERIDFTNKNLYELIDGYRKGETP